MTKKQYLKVKETLQVSYKVRVYLYKEYLHTIEKPSLKRLKNCGYWATIKEINDDYILFRISPDYTKASFMYKIPYTQIRKIVNYTQN